MSRRWFVVMGLVVVFALAVSGSGMAASNNCSRVGTFHGLGDSGASWLAAFTPGQSATSGQFTLQWVVAADPTFGGFFPADRVTNAMGVWEKINGDTYAYTWIAYGVTEDGALVYVARASGTDHFDDCDNASVTYALELFDPAQDISTESPAYGTYCGTAAETRMALAHPTCP